MIYFDILPVLQMLNNLEKGMLFEAILRYAHADEEPVLPDQLQLVWPLVKKRLDSDYERYNLTVTRRKYAAYVRWEKEHHRDPLPFTKWVDEHRDIDFDEEIAIALA